MTPGHKLAVVLLLAALVLLGAALVGLNHQHRRLSLALRGEEAARLELQHQIVLREETQNKLSWDAAVLAQQNQELQTALDAAKKAAPGAKVSAAGHFETAPAEVGPPPPEAPPLPECEGNHYATDRRGNFVCAQAAGEPSLPTPPQGEAKPAACVLSSSDQAWFKVDLISLTTQEQNTLAIGTAELWRAGSPDRRVLGPSHFQSALSQAEAPLPSSSPRWGALALGLCEARGCGLGAGVLAPPLALWGFRLEAQGAVLAGPAWAALAGVGVRW